MLTSKGVMGRAFGALLVGGLVAACSDGFEAPAELAAVADQVPAKLDYNWDIRPILSQNCFQCHGNDPKNRKAGLRLDLAEAAYGKLPENLAKRAIYPGRPGESELVHRILNADPEERMPPLVTHKTLTTVQQATLIKWIKDGAPYKDHWAYTAPKVEKVAKTPFNERVVNEIDSYVFAKLAEKGLTPSAEADKETLINRVTLDLTGLPPTLEEVDAFLADKGSDAYERLVDRLLASPAYGERQANAWLDVARYSESDGYLDDLHDRTTSPYRDWVISAFNRNLPYDKFVTWQLAGDLLPGATTEQILATAFGRMGKRSTENGLIDEEVRVDYRNERSELIGKAFLGLTVGCARCHDHKYDVISQADYYSLAGFFNSIDERGLNPPGYWNLTMGPTLDWPSDEQRAQHQQARQALEKSEATLADLRNSAAKSAQSRVESLLKSKDGIAREIEGSVAKGLAAYFPLDQAYKGPIDQFKYVRPPAAVPPRPKAKEPTSGKVASAQEKSARRAGQLPALMSENTLFLTPSGIKGMAPGGMNEPKFTEGVRGKAFLVDNNKGFLAEKVGWYERYQEFSFDMWVKPPADKAFKDAMIASHMDHTAWTADSGYTLNIENGHLRFDVIHVSPSDMLSVVTKDEIPAGKWDHIAVTYDGSSKAKGIRLFLDGKPLALEIRRDHLTRTILPTMTMGCCGADFLGFHIGNRARSEEFKGAAIDEIRIFSRMLSPIEVAWLHAPEEVLARDATALKQGVAEMLVENDAGVEAGKRDFVAAAKVENDIASHTPQIMVMGDTKEPRPTYVLKAGLYTNPGEEVRPAGPSRVFPWSAETYGENRLGMTKWLFDEKNPLTARVFVNRVWQGHFGTGIVATVEDFGTQGTNPTHPELLDWLALQFVKSGWDIKALHKLVVMSATYRQTSDVTEELIEKDRTNMWLARGPRYRLPAETIRDSALFASGLLVRKVGGESVYPLQPDGVWKEAASRYPYPTDVPEDANHRRSMYTFVKRSVQPPSMATFDFADRNVSTVSRRISNTPLQALVLLNDPQFMEAYQKLSLRVLESNSDPDAQLTTLFRLATRRHPAAAEMDAMRDYRQEITTELSGSKGRVEEILAKASLVSTQSVDRVQWAAMTMVAAGVMNAPAAYMFR